MSSHSPESASAPSPDRALSLAEALRRTAADLCDPRKNSIERLPLVRRLQEACRAYAGSAAPTKDPVVVAQDDASFLALSTLAGEIADDLQHWAEEVFPSLSLTKQRAQIDRVERVRKALGRDDPTRTVRMFLLECVFSAVNDLPLLRQRCGEPYKDEGLFVTRPGTAVGAVEFAERLFRSHYPDHAARLDRPALAHALRVCLRGGPGRPSQGDLARGGRWDAFLDLLVASRLAAGRDALSVKGLRTEWGRYVPEAAARSRLFRKNVSRLLKNWELPRGGMCSELVIDLLLNDG